MQGARRVIAFCLLVGILPFILLVIPLHLRHSVYADVTYAVAESDILEIVNGISSVFCQEHSLEMNSSFSAFQIKGPPQVSPTVRKHVKLKKSMSLIDDTLEYWGFYLPASSTVLLSVCSRYDGSRLLVVKGERNLRDCGLAQPLKSENQLPENIGNKVLVTFEAPMEEEAKIDTNLQSEDIGAEDNEDDFIDRASLLMDPTFNEERSMHLEDEPTERKHRHSRSRHRRMDEDTALRRKTLEEKLNTDASYGTKKLPGRFKRLVELLPSHMLDGGIAHGGQGVHNSTSVANESSASSFESSLLTCYEGQVLLAQSFSPSKSCVSPAYLETGKHLQAKHEIDSAGYYYYIFYSDNDYVENDIHAIFDIYKPTYLYGNYSVGCINETECTFPISFMSGETVIVEVPTKDGIENKTEDISYLISKCHPRSAVYAIFPVSVLFLILACSFL